MLRIGTASCLLLCACACRAQVSGSVGIVSDDRYRGLSLSDGEPALQATLNRDFAHGAYAGAMVSLDLEDGWLVRWLPYAGIAGTRGPLRWDAGVQYHGIRDGRGSAQVFAGVGGESVQARAYYAPRYFGAGSAWYLELDAQRRLSPRWRLLAHAGALRVRDEYGDARMQRDARAGVAFRWNRIDVQLAWVHACCARAYVRTTTDGGTASGYPLDGSSETAIPPPVDRDQDRVPDRTAWVLALSRRW